jgi:hypothetical protein
VLANLRYWPTVAPVVRAELRGWQERAASIPDPTLRAIALTKLREERFHSEALATLATLAPREQRTRATRAIVAFEVIYDYLDGVTERPSRHAATRGRALYRAFTDAVSVDRVAAGCYFGQIAGADDGGFLQALTDAVRCALGELPAAEAVAATARRCAARCANAQVLHHASGTPSEVERWARREAALSALGWREFLAGAMASVVPVHALIAAAADPQTTPEHAACIDATYFPMCALSTLLDALVDRAQDARQGIANVTAYYEDPERLAHALVETARLAAQRAHTLPRAGHHLLSLVGIVAYYTSTREARTGAARVVAEQIDRELAPLIWPTLAVMRCWRFAKRAGGRRSLPRRATAPRLPRLPAPGEGARSFDPHASHA